MVDGITAQWLQRLGAQVAWAYGLRVLLALGGAMAAIGLVGGSYLAFPTM